MTDNSRLEQKEAKINEEIENLNSKVKRFTNFAWGFVALGFWVIIGGFAFGDFKSFSEFGDFVGGSVGSIWSLAGLLFVYVAFLGQKQSILNQQIEILYNQEELRATRKELAGQKEQMELQNATLKQQQFENTFFNLLENYNEFMAENTDRINDFWKGYILIHQNARINYSIEEYFLTQMNKDNYSPVTKDFLIFIESLLLIIKEQSNYNNQLYKNLVITKTDKSCLVIYYYYSIHVSKSLMIDETKCQEYIEAIKSTKTSMYDKVLTEQALNRK